MFGSDFEIVKIIFFMFKSLRNMPLNKIGFEYNEIDFNNSKSLAIIGWPSGKKKRNSLNN